MKSNKGEERVQRPISKSFEFKGQSEGVQGHYQHSTKALQIKHPGIWKDKKSGQKVVQLSRQKLSNGPISIPEFCNKSNIYLIHIQKIEISSYSASMQSLLENIHVNADLNAIQRWRQVPHFDNSSYRHCNQRVFCEKLTVR